MRVGAAVEISRCIHCPRSGFRQTNGFGLRALASVEETVEETRGSLATGSARREPRMTFRVTRIERGSRSAKVSRSLRARNPARGVVASPDKPTRALTRCRTLTLHLLVHE